MELKEIRRIIVIMGEMLGENVYTYYIYKSFNQCFEREQFILISSVNVIANIFDDCVLWQKILYTRI